MKPKNFPPEGDGDDWDENDESFLKRLERRRYDAANPPPEPNPIFSICGVPVCTAQNLTTLSAQAKQGKTSAVEAMLASTFAQNGADCLGFQSDNREGRAAIRIDSELSPFDHHRSNQRVLSRAGVKAAPEWLLSYCLSDLTAAGIRRAIRVTLESAVQKFGGVFVLVVDGIADAVSDVNDAKEANGMVAELHALAIEFGCSVVAVIHCNPGSDYKTRGHLGSQLERKAESNLRLEKDADGTVTLFADKNRGAPIPKATGPRFGWSDEAGMHLSVESRQRARNDLERDELEDLFGRILSIGRTMSFTELVAAVRKVVSVSERTAERKIRKADTMGIVAKNPAGLYGINA
jgi:hypothetical protein